MIYMHKTPVRQSLNCLTQAALFCCLVQVNCSAQDASQAIEPPLKTIVFARLPEWQHDVWEKVDVYGRFVTGSELDNNPLFRSLAPSALSEAADREEVYLLTVCQPNANPGKRILEVTASVRISDHYKHEFALIPYGKGFLTRGRTFNLVKIVSADWLLPGGSREELLKSKPEITITQMSAK